MLEKLTLMIVNEVTGVMIEEYTFRVYDFVEDDEDSEEERLSNELLIRYQNGIISIKEYNAGIHKLVEVKTANLVIELKRMLLQVLRMDDSSSSSSGAAPPGGVGGGPLSFTFYVGTCEIENGTTTAAANNVGVKGWEEVSKPKTRGGVGGRGGSSASLVPIGRVNSDPVCISLSKTAHESF